MSWCVYRLSYAILVLLFSALSFLFSWRSRWSVTPLFWRWILFLLLSSTLSTLRFWTRKFFRIRSFLSTVQILFGMYDTTFCHSRGPPKFRVRLVGYWVVLIPVSAVMMSAVISSISVVLTITTIATSSTKPFALLTGRRTWYSTGKGGLQW